MLVASPQKRQPIPNIAYPNSKTGFLPKISLSLPYNVWKDVEVKK